MAEKLIMANSAAMAAAEKNPCSAFLGGGTEINRLGSTVEAETLISLKKASDLKGVSVNDEFIRIGAGSTFQEVLEEPAVPEYLKEALHFMASRTKRNMATIGGNVALLRSDSYLVPTLMAAGAKLEIMQPDGAVSIICVKKYLAERAAYTDALILAVLLYKAGNIVLSKRYANTAQSHAALTVSMGSCRGSNLSIAAAVKNAGVYDLQDLADVIEADPAIAEDAIIDWCYNCKRLQIADDMFGSEKYKRYLLGVTVSLMWEQAGKGGK